MERDVQLLQDGQGGEIEGGDQPRYEISRKGHFLRIFWGGHPGGGQGALDGLELRV